MSEKLLMCDALDERDLLRKRLTSAIEDLQLIGAKRKKDTRVGIIPADKFEESAKSAYQSVKDNIERYNRLDVAITMSNATTTVKLNKSGKEMTVAAAITLKNSIKGGRNKVDTDFVGMLLSRMQQQYDSAVSIAAQYDRKASMELETYKTNFVNRDNKKALSEDEINSIEKLVADLYSEVIDPLNLKDEMTKLNAEYEDMLKELETAIKVSNATTFVEF